jgi:membrane protein implicated in regulation of membrane protease activity
MALSYKSRRRWSLFILVVGLPIYIIIVVNLVAFLPNLPKVLEFLMYVFLGIVWIFPLKLVFQGIGQPDPDDEKRN